MLLFLDIVEASIRRAQHRALRPGCNRSLSSWPNGRTASPPEQAQDRHAARRCRRSRRFRKAGQTRQAGLFDEPLPKWIRPCLPTLVAKPRVGPQWAHEIKRDGYRVSAYVADGKATIRTRNGHDWMARFPAIARDAAAPKVRSAVLDGEAVILDERGRSSFVELQADLTRHGSERAMLYAFDLLFLDGEALWKRPLALASIVPKHSAIVLSEDLAGVGA